MKAYTQTQNVIEAIKNVAMYIRKSRGEEEKDLEKHTLIMREICENNGWRFIEYPEIGSGDNIADRPRMQELLNDVFEDMYDAVFVFDYDRLGRGSGTDQDTIRNTLRRADTLIIIANPFEILDPNDERDQQSMEFKGFLARQEYHMISKRLSSGRKIALKMGRWAIGAAPYGYDYDSKLKGLVPNKEQAEIYKKLIVQEYVNGSSTYDIAWQLNRKKIPSPRNGLWNNQTVRNMLRSEVYLGSIVYNKSEGVRASQTKSLDKKPFKQKSRDEWTTVKNCHHAIKTEEEHLRILAHMKEKNHHNKNSVNSLSGVIKCFNCGSTLMIQKNKESTSIKKCRNCDACKGGEIELVYDAIKDSIVNIRESLVEMKSSYSNEKEKNIILAEIKEVENELDTNEKAIERIEKAYEDGLYDTEKTKKKIKERQEIVFQLEEELKKKKFMLNSFSQVSNEERIARIDKFLNDIESPTNQKSLNLIYKSILNSVIWERTEWYDVKITVNFL